MKGMYFRMFLKQSSISKFLELYTIVNYCVKDILKTCFFLKLSNTYFKILTDFYIDEARFPDLFVTDLRDSIPVDKGDAKNC